MFYIKDHRGYAYNGVFTAGKIRWESMHKAFQCYIFTDKKQAEECAVEIRSICKKDIGSNCLVVPLKEE